MKLSDLDLPIFLIVIIAFMVGTVILDSPLDSSSARPEKTFVTQTSNKLIPDIVSRPGREATEIHGVKLYRLIMLPLSDPKFKLCSGIFINSPEIPGPKLELIPAWKSRKINGKWEQYLAGQRLCLKQEYFKEEDFWRVSPPAS